MNVVDQSSILPAQYSVMFVAVISATATSEKVETIKYSECK
mgnify:CR=1 FL=1|jgi:hypothetical protein